MTIDRGPWNALVDDDGSNLVGSVWNKAAIKTVILDPTDAAIAAGASPITGPWTPVDASGAGLALGVVAASYWKLTTLVMISAYVYYPSTGDANAAKIGGLPFPNGAAAGGLYATNLTVHGLFINGGQSIVEVRNGTTGVARSNAEMTGVNLIISGVYLTTA